MRSKHVDYFNHDPEAGDYDAEVAREKHPIRSGYRMVLAFIGGHVLSGRIVLDLGSGTGNSILPLPNDSIVTAVDISTKMTAIARQKLSDREVSFVIEDIIQYIDSAPLTGFDVITSAYALHHLTPDERRHLFSAIRRKARVGVQILVGDLMYADEADRERIIQKYGRAFPDIVVDFEDEYFWNVAQSARMFDEIGMQADWHRLSDLSWAVELSFEAHL